MRIEKRFTASVVALCLAGTSDALAEISIPFEKYTLKNGLSVILHHDPRLPLVAVSVWYDVGALHEKPRQSGFAHLFEHMMFQGSKHIPEDQHFALLEAAGGTHINGTTDFDRTNYIETVPANELELALWMESDRMGYLLSSLTDKSLKNQIEVVKNERRQSVENAPYGLFYEKIMQTLFSPSHPYFGSIIGSMEDLSSASTDDIRDFWRTYYSPSNATLAIAGDFDPKTIREKIDKYFASLRGAAKPNTPNPPSPVLREPMRIVFDEPMGTLDKLVIVWMAPPAFAADTAELELFAHVLSGTKSARLDARISYENPIAQSVTAGLRSYRAASWFQIEVTLRPKMQVADAERAIDEVMADFARRPPTPAELSRAKSAVETANVFGLELLGGFSGRLERLQYYHLHLKDPGKLAWDIARRNKVTVDELQRAKETWLGPNRLVAWASPKRAEASRGAP